MNSLFLLNLTHLSFRNQIVSIDNICSESQPVKSGIPQGSVLGPLFFLIFIDDITSDIPVTIKLFADDCILYLDIRSPHDQALLNTCLTKISSWCATWQMRVNEQKMVAMTVTRKRLPLRYEYSINGQELSFVNTYKYLGVVLSTDFKWNEHVDYIEKRAMQKLGFLTRSLRRSTPRLKLLAYKTFIRPILGYASVVWGPRT